MIPLYARVPVYVHGYRWVDDKDWGRVLGVCPDERDPRNVEWIASMHRQGEQRESLSRDEDLVGWLPAYFRTYEPFSDTPALFLEFTQIEESEEAFVAFANQYGHLLFDGVQYGIFPTDSFKRWCDTHAGLRHAVDAWNGYKSGDKESVRCLEWMFQRQFSVQPKVRRNNGKGISFVGVVGHLREVLWAQLFMAILADKQYRQCGHCSKPFEVTPEITRNDRLFCSDACRMKAYRRRQSTAKRMRAEGRKLRQIAKELGTDLETLKNWLGE